MLCLLAGCGGGSSGEAPAAAGQIAVVRLVPAAPDAPAAEVTVPATSAQVQLRLAGLDRPATELTAELERVGADQIRRWPVVDAPADADGLQHAVILPVYEARPGDYVLTLWAGDVEIVRRYRYRVAMDK